MTVEVDVGVLVQRVDDLTRRMDGAESHIGASVAARADTNARLTSLEAGQKYLTDTVGEIKALLVGAVWKAAIGGVASIAILVALLILVLAAGPGAVADAVRLLLSRAGA